MGDDLGYFFQVSTSVVGAVSGYSRSDTGGSAVGRLERCPTRVSGSLAATATAPEVCCQKHDQRTGRGHRPFAKHTQLSPNLVTCIVSLTTPRPTERE